MLETSVAAEIAARASRASRDAAQCTGRIRVITIR